MSSLENTIVLEPPEDIDRPSEEEDYIGEIDAAPRLHNVDQDDDDDDDDDQNLSIEEAEEEEEDMIEREAKRVYIQASRQSSLNRAQRVLYYLRRLLSRQPILVAVQENVVGASLSLNDLENENENENENDDDDEKEQQSKEQDEKDDENNETIDDDTVDSDNDEQVSKEEKEKEKEKEEKDEKKKKKKKLLSSIAVNVIATVPEWRVAADMSRTGRTRFNALMKAVAKEEEDAASRSETLEEATGAATDRSEHWQGAGGAAGLRVGVNTQVVSIAPQNRVVFMLDVNEKLGRVDAYGGTVLWRRLWTTLDSSLRALVRPMRVPGDAVPTLLVSIVACIPNARRANKSSGEQEKIDEQQQQKESARRRTVGFDSVTDEHFDGGRFIPLLSAQMFRPSGDDRALDQMLDCLLGDVRLKFDALQRDLRAVRWRASSDMAMLLRGGLFALQSMPSTAAPSLVVLTDGVCCVPDASLYDSVAMSLNRQDVATVIVQAGATHHPSAPFGQLAEFETLQTLCRSVSGVLFADVASLFERHGGLAGEANLTALQRAICWREFWPNWPSSLSSSAAAASTSASLPPTFALIEDPMLGEIVNLSSNPQSLNAMSIADNGFPWTIAIEQRGVVAADCQASDDGDELALCDDVDIDDHFYDSHRYVVDRAERLLKIGLSAARKHVAMVARQRGSDDSDGADEPPLLSQRRSSLSMFGVESRIRPPPVPLLQVFFSEYEPLVDGFRLMDARAREGFNVASVELERSAVLQQTELLVVWVLAWRTNVKIIYRLHITYDSVSRRQRCNAHIQLCASYKFLRRFRKANSSNGGGGGADGVLSRHSAAAGAKDAQRSMRFDAQQQQQHHQQQRQPLSSSGDASRLLQFLSSMRETDRILQRLVIKLPRLQPDPPSFWRYLSQLTTGRNWHRWFHAIHFLEVVLLTDPLPDVDTPAYRAYHRRLAPSRALDSNSNGLTFDQATAALLAACDRWASCAHSKQLYVRFLPQAGAFCLLQLYAETDALVNLQLAFFGTPAAAQESVVDSLCAKLERLPPLALCKRPLRRLLPRYDAEPRSLRRRPDSLNSLYALRRFPWPVQHSQLHALPPLGGAAAAMLSASTLRRRTVIRMPSGVSGRLLLHLLALSRSREGFLFVNAHTFTLQTEIALHLVDPTDPTCLVPTTCSALYVVYECQPNRVVTELWVESHHRPAALYLPPLVDPSAATLATAEQQPIESSDASLPKKMPPLFVGDVFGTVGDLIAQSDAQIASALYSFKMVDDLVATHARDTLDRQQAERAGALGVSADAECYPHFDIKALIGPCTRRLTDTHRTVRGERKRMIESARALSAMLADEIRAVACCALPPFSAALQLPNQPATVQRWQCFAKSIDQHHFVLALVRDFSERDDAPPAPDGSGDNACSRQGFDIRVSYVEVEREELYAIMPSVSSDLHALLKLNVRALHRNDESLAMLMRYSASARAKQHANFSSVTRALRREVAYRYGRCYSCVAFSMMNAGATLARDDFRRAISMCGTYSKSVDITQFLRLLQKSAGNDALDGYAAADDSESVHLRFFAAVNEYFKPVPDADKRYFYYSPSRAFASSNRSALLSAMGGGASSSTKNVLTASLESVLESAIDSSSSSSDDDDGDSQSGGGGDDSDDRRGVDTRERHRAAALRSPGGAVVGSESVDALDGESWASTKNAYGIYTSPIYLTLQCVVSDSPLQQEQRRQQRDEVVRFAVTKNLLPTPDARSAVTASHARTSLVLTNWSLPPIDESPGVADDDAADAPATMTTPRKNSAELARVNYRCGGIYGEWRVNFEPFGDEGAGDSDIIGRPRRADTVQLQPSRVPKELQQVMKELSKRSQSLVSDEILNLLRLHRPLTPPIMRIVEHHLRSSKSRSLLKFTVPLHFLDATGAAQIFPDTLKSHFSMPIRQVGKYDGGDADGGGGDASLDASLAATSSTNDGDGDASIHVGGGQLPPAQHMVFVVHPIKSRSGVAVERSTDDEAQDKDQDESQQQEGDDDNEQSNNVAVALMSPQLTRHVRSSSVDATAQRSRSQSFTGRRMVATSASDRNMSAESAAPLSLDKADAADGGSQQAIVSADALLSSPRDDDAFLVPYWLFIVFENATASVWFHSYRKPSPISIDERRDVLTQVSSGLHALATRVNQIILLQRLYETRLCSELLVPLPENVAAADAPVALHSMDEDSVAIEDADAIDLTPGSFACPLQHSIVLKLHDRLSASVARPALVGTVLQLFYVSNRRNVYVYRKQSGDIFYFELYPPPPPAAEQQQQQQPLRRERAAAAGSGGDQSSSTAERLDDVYELVLRVYGLDPPGEEITEHLARMLERKLAAITLNIVSGSLQRNPQMKLSEQDVVFLKPSHEAAKLLVATFPPASLGYDMRALFADFVLPSLVKNFLFEMQRESPGSSSSSSSSSSPSADSDAVEFVAKTPPRTRASTSSWSSAASSLYDEPDMSLIYNYMLQAKGRAGPRDQSSAPVPAICRRVGQGIALLDMHLYYGDAFDSDADDAATPRRARLSAYANRWLDASKRGVGVESFKRGANSRSGSLGRRKKHHQQEQEYKQPPPPPPRFSSDQCALHVRIWARGALNLDALMTELGVRLNEALACFVIERQLLPAAPANRPELSVYLDALDSATQRLWDADLAAVRVHDFSETLVLPSWQQANFANELRDIVAETDPRSPPLLFSLAPSATTTTTTTTTRELSDAERAARQFVDNAGLVIVAGDVPASLLPADVSLLVAPAAGGTEHPSQLAADLRKAAKRNKATSKRKRKKKRKRKDKKKKEAQAGAGSSSSPPPPAAVAAAMAATPAIAATSTAQTASTTVAAVAQSPGLRAVLNHYREMESQKRKCFLVAHIGRRRVRIVSYGWSAPLSEHLGTLLNRLEFWSHLRSLLLDTVLHYKLGLFQHVGATAMRPRKFRTDNIDALLRSAAPGRRHSLAASSSSSTTNIDALPSLQPSRSPRSGKSSSPSRSAQHQQMQSRRGVAARRRRRRAGDVDNFDRVLRDQPARVPMGRSVHQALRDPLMRHGLHYLAAARIEHTLVHRHGVRRHVYGTLFRRALPAPPVSSATSAAELAAVGLPPVGDAAAQSAAAAASSSLNEVSMRSLLGASRLVHVCRVPVSLYLPSPHLSAPEPLDFDAHSHHAIGADRRAKVIEAILGTVVDRFAQHLQHLGLRFVPVSSSAAVAAAAAAVAAQQRQQQQHQPPHQHQHQHQHRSHGAHLSDSDGRASSPQSLPGMLDAAALMGQHQRSRSIGAKLYMVEMCAGGIVLVECELIDDGALLRTNVYSVPHTRSSRQLHGSGVEVPSRRFDHRQMMAKEFIDRVSRLRHVLQAEAIVYDGCVQQVWEMLERGATRWCSASKNFYYAEAKRRHHEHGGDDDDDADDAEACEDELPLDEDGVASHCIELLGLVHRLWLRYEARGPPLCAHTAVREFDIAVPLPPDAERHAAAVFAFAHDRAHTYGMHSLDNAGVAPVLFRLDFCPQHDHSGNGGGSNESTAAEYSVMLLCSLGGDSALTVRVFVLRRLVDHAERSYGAEVPLCIEAVLADVADWVGDMMQRVVGDFCARALWMALCARGATLSLRGIERIPTTLRGRSWSQWDASLAELAQQGTFGSLHTLVGHLKSVYAPRRLLRQVHSDVANVTHLLVFSELVPQRFFLHVAVDFANGEFRVTSYTRAIEAHLRHFHAELSLSLSALPSSLSLSSVAASSSALPTAMSSSATALPSTPTSSTLAFTSTPSSALPPPPSSTKLSDRNIERHMISSFVNSVLYVLWLDLVAQ
jgi:hypothetical protein